MWIGIYSSNITSYSKGQADTCKIINSSSSCWNICELNAHCSKHASSSIPKWANLMERYLILIWCITMLQYCQLQTECTFREPYYLTLEQMDWNLQECSYWNDFFGGQKSPNIFLLCWFPSKLSCIFIFVLMLFTENFQYRVLVLSAPWLSNVQLHLSTLPDRCLFCFLVNTPR